MVGSLPRMKGSTLAVLVVFMALAAVAYMLPALSSSNATHSSIAAGTINSNGAMILSYTGVQLPEWALIFLTTLDATTAIISFVFWWTGVTLPAYLAYRALTLGVASL